jgi:5-hydroxyisourate hydrolase-like protein (transthyretin family)
VSAISTHVLDIAAGCPAAGMRVRLERVAGAGQQQVPAGEEVASGSTDASGRIASLGPDTIAPGTYRLIFDTGGYLTRQRDSACGAAQRRGGGASDAPQRRGDGAVVADGGAFFPEVTVTFTVTAGEHYHVPLLMSPFGYSTYRGS